MRLSEINPYITPEMETFLETMAKIARGYSISELNERLEARGGYFVYPLSEVISNLEKELGAKGIDVIKQNNGRYYINFFVGERDEKKKDGCIMNIGGLP